METRLTSCPACEGEYSASHRYAYTPTTMDKLPLFDERDIVYCTDCGFGRIEEDVDDQVLASYYNSEYSGKAKKSAETTRVNTRTPSSIDVRAISQILLIQQHLDLNQCTMVVEIGAGTGGFLFALRQFGYTGKYIAVEPQVQAHEILQSYGAQVEREVFTQAKAEQMQGTADLVVMSHSLEHFNPGAIAGILKAISKILKPGGAYFCEVPNADLRYYPDAGERVVPHLSFFSPESLERFIEHSGMEVVRTVTCGALQSEKRHGEEIAKLEDQGHFEFVRDESSGIMRNVRYHQYLERERVRQGKRHRLLGLAASVLGQVRLSRVIDLYRRIKQSNPLRQFNNSAFTYGPGREFIRSLSVKREVNQD